MDSCVQTQPFLANNYLSATIGSTSTVLRQNPSTQLTRNSSLNLRELTGDRVLMGVLVMGLEDQPLVMTHKEGVTMGRHLDTRHLATLHQDIRPHPSRPLQDTLFEETCLTEKADQVTVRL